MLDNSVSSSVLSLTLGVSSKLGFLVQVLMISLFLTVCNITTTKQQHEVVKSTETAMCLELNTLGLYQRRKNISVLEQNHAS